MSATNLDKLKSAAEAGNIDILYTVIQDDPSILEIIDLKQFVETPLHIAASRGHLLFSIEVMNLKPSFASKLNQLGFSPIHLAMQNNHKRMVLCFVDMNKELVRVKGKEGWTPLHFASQIGELDFLAEFLTTCPDSIKDVTSRGETALHIAVKNNNYEALDLLVCFLRKNIEKGASELESKILNQKDEADNTILHISALSNQQPQIIQLLVRTKINLKAKNLENKTALDIATTPENKTILLSAGSKPSSEVIDAPTLAHELRSKFTIIDKISTYISRIERDISPEQRNTWLIIATLAATATYQSALTPVGGVYQVSASDQSVSITSTNSTISTLGNAGKSVLSRSDFFVFSYMNILSFLLSTIAILIMTPEGRAASRIVTGAVCLLVFCYIFSLWRISPTHANTVAFKFIFFGGIAFLAIFSIIIAGAMIFK